MGDRLDAAALLIAERKLERLGCGDPKELARYAADILIEMEAAKRYGMGALDPKCQAGCMSFEGGEVKHRRDCVHYPESLTKLWHDTEGRYVADLAAMELALRQVRNQAPLGSRVRVIADDALTAFLTPRN